MTTKKAIKLAFYTYLMILPPISAAVMLPILLGNLAPWYCGVGIIATILPTMIIIYCYMALAGRIIDGC